MCTMSVFCAFRYLVDKLCRCFYNSPVILRLSSVVFAGRAPSRVWVNGQPDHVVPLARKVCCKFLLLFFLLLPSLPLVLWNPGSGGSERFAAGATCAITRRGGGRLKRSSESKKRRGKKKESKLAPKAKAKPALTTEERVAEILARYCMVHDPTNKCEHQVCSCRKS